MAASAGAGEARRRRFLTSGPLGVADVPPAAGPWYPLGVGEQKPAGRAQLVIHFVGVVALGGWNLGKILASGVTLTAKILAGLVQVMTLLLLMDL